MSYSIRFDTEAPDAEWTAFQAIVDYLGEDTANRAFGTMLLAAPEMTPAQARFAWSFAGVQGYPVECWINRYIGDRA